ncbi:unnamed protein product [Adineta ricciae]|uniref:G-protein coupled receptors family 1 profile domain-containing protein n=1 Tax=Adineta ricciae TaxID=249248 RepID=A0A815FDE4_ADIRI|nr:unnamed protein product [Adineta ricciae]
MLLVTNSCAALCLSAAALLSISIFTLINDYEQIEYEDSLCIFRAHVLFISYAALNYSYLLQSSYRYAIVVYPTYLFFQSIRTQIILICIIWICAITYPFAFDFNGEIIYNVNNQICMLQFHISFSLFYAIAFAYTIPILFIILLYFKLVRYVKQMNKRVVIVNTLYRARQQLQMVQRVVILVMILFVNGFPYVFFIILTLFGREPKYYLRIPYIFINISMVLVTIALYRFTDPLKESIKKNLRRRTNIVTAGLT